MTAKINLIMKVTSKCNLACSYCQYTADLTTTNNNLIMSREILQRSISQLMALPSKNVTLIWHGGEPLLVGIDFYEEVICLLQHQKKESQKIINNIQTNATLLNEEWINFFQKNNFNISISLDGPSKIHKMQRLYPSGTDSFTHIMQAVKLLMDYKLKFGLLSVVTKESIKKPKEIYNFLKTITSRVLISFLASKSIKIQVR